MGRGASSNSIPEIERARFLFVIGSNTTEAHPVLALRIKKAVRNGGTLVVADLMGPGKRGQGVALVLSGLTIANVVGVPLITWVGQLHGWRASYWLVAAIFALSVVAV